MSTAQNDAARTLLGTSVVINVLSNDSGGTLSIVGYTMPTFGALALNPDQSFTYTPAAGFVGGDNFTYTVRDGLGGTASAEVAITVARPNAAPNARNDVAQMLTGDSVAVAVLANDNDPDGDTFGIVGIDAPGHGTVQVEPDQKIRYTAQPGFSGIDSFTYTIGDGRGGVGTANVSVTVTARNSPPIAVADSRVDALRHRGHDRCPGQRQRPRRRLRQPRRDEPARPRQPHAHARAAVRLHAGRRVHRRGQLHLHDPGRWRCRRHGRGQPDGGAEQRAAGGDARHCRVERRPGHHRSAGQRQRSRRRPTPPHRADAADQRPDHRQCRQPGHLHAGSGLRRHRRLHLPGQRRHRGGRGPGHADGDRTRCRRPMPTASAIAAAS